MTPATATAPSLGLHGAAHVEVLLRLADSCLVLGHRLSEWCGRAPVLEEEMALANIGLDLIGQARALLAHAGRVEGRGRDEDALAYLRDAHEYRNLLLTEQPNGDFAVTMARQLFYSAAAEPLWAALSAWREAELAGIAGKARKEAAYHVRHAAQWVVRLGDGTAESHRRMQAAVDSLWMYTGELFERDDVDAAAIAAGVGADATALEPGWDRLIGEVLAEATLTRPRDAWMAAGGRRGRHTEHLGHLLADMQFLQRAYPGAGW